MSMPKWAKKVEWNKSKRSTKVHAFDNPGALVPLCGAARLGPWDGGSYSRHLACKRCVRAAQTKYEEGTMTRKKVIAETKSDSRTVTTYSNGHVDIRETPPGSVLNQAQLVELAEFIRGFRYVIGLCDSPTDPPNKEYLDYFNKNRPHEAHTNSWMRGEQVAFKSLTRVINAERNRILRQP